MNGRTPKQAILLIHGAWHWPWCWDAFADRLRGRGHDVRAMRLRGHDGQRGRIWHRLRDYVEDVERAAAEFDWPPIPVGHSMGGLLAQRYLERNPAPGAVLMASISTGGVLGAVARLAARHPVAFSKANALLRLGPLVSTSALVRDLFFTAQTPQAVVDDCQARLQDESYLAFLDMLLFLARPRPRQVKAPMLVLGAEHDGFFTVGELRLTARAYRTEAEIFPGMGHDMMLDQGWEKVADRIDTWSRTLPEPTNRAPQDSALP
jgi:alpha-beta hydrolase superfamily lysophospholipase